MTGVREGPFGSFFLRYTRTSPRGQQSRVSGNDKQKAAQYLLIQCRYNVDTISIQYGYNIDTIQYNIIPKIPENTQKLPKMPKNIQKYLKIPKNTQIYPKIPKINQKSSKVPMSTQKYLKVT